MERRGKERKGKEAREELDSPSAVSHFEGNSHGSGPAPRPVESVHEREHSLS